MLALGAPDEFRQVDQFTKWLQTDQLSKQFVQYLTMTLPKPRQKYYESANYDEI